MAGEWIYEYVYHLCDIQLTMRVCMHTCYYMVQPLNISMHHSLPCHVKSQLNLQIFAIFQLPSAVNIYVVILANLVTLININALTMFLWSSPSTVTKKFLRVS